MVLSNKSQKISSYPKSKHGRKQSDKKGPSVSQVVLHLLDILLQADILNGSDI